MNHCYKHINSNLFMLGFFPPTIPTGISWIFHSKYIRNETVPLKKAICPWGVFKGGDQGTTADTSRKAAAHRRNRIWDPYACETCSHAWKPCSSTAFLTLASYLGFRSFCSTHMDNGDCLLGSGRRLGTTLENTIKTTPTAPCRTKGAKSSPTPGQPGLSSSEL